MNTLVGGDTRYSSRQYGSVVVDDDDEEKYHGGVAMAMTMTNDRQQTQNKQGASSVSSSSSLSSSRRRFVVATGLLVALCLLFAAATATTGGPAPPFATASSASLINPSNGTSSSGEIQPQTTTPRQPFYSWSGWAIGFRGYWYDKHVRWNKLEAKLKAKNASKEEIKQAKKEFWSKSSNESETGTLPEKKEEDTTDDDEE